jgi:hypothetical protein
LGLCFLLPCAVAAQSFALEATVMYLQREPLIAENKSTTHRMHRTYRITPLQTDLDGGSAKLMLPMAVQKPSVLRLHFNTFIEPAHPSQKIEVYLGDSLLKEASFMKAGVNQIDIPIPGSMANQQKLELLLKFPNNISPKALGIGDDTRNLAIGIIWAEYL